MDERIRTLLWSIGNAVSVAIGLWVMSLILDGFDYGSWTDLFIISIVLVVIQTLLWPYLYRAAAAIHPLVFPVLIFALTAGIFLFAVWLVDERGTGRIEVDGWETAIWLALGVTLVSTLLTSIFALDDMKSYDVMVTEGLDQTFDGEKTEEPGLFYLEIDGLSAPLLHDAMAKGFMPNLTRWMLTRGYSVTEWQPNLSSQTSASQAGILLGNNHNIPAFRWWDKPRQKLMVSSKMNTAKALEEELESDRGLLQYGGASRFNVFSGASHDSVATFSSLAVKSGSNSYFAYFMNPYLIARTFSLFIQECFREWWQEFRQNRNDVQPRIERPFPYAFTRAACTALMVEAAHFMIIADMMRGIPSAYYTIFAYDETAHHTGPDRDYTYKVLTNLDKMFGHLEQVAQRAPRPYTFVILSDHGQSMGWSFKQRYGMTLGDLVADLLPSDASVLAMLESHEGQGNISALLSEVGDDSRTGKAISRALTDKTAESGEVMLADEKTTAEAAKNDVLVLASGNLGLISFIEYPERLTAEEMRELFPGLLSGLASHPGIGFILVDSKEEGGLIMGPGGFHYLRDGHVDGVDPLAGYGELAAQHVKRTHEFDNCPDILAISTYWPEDDSVAAFEELVGNHGGLGGNQQRPFIFHPPNLKMPTEQVIGAGSLNDVMRSWILQLQPDAISQPPVDKMVEAN